MARSHKTTERSNGAAKKSAPRPRRKTAPADEPRSPRPAPAQAEEFARELAALREQAGAAAEQFQAALRQSAEQLLQQRGEAEQWLARVRQEFRAVSEQLLGEFGSEIQRVRGQLHEAGQLLRAVPEEAERYRLRVAQLARRLPAAEERLQTVEQVSGAAQQELAELEQEARAAAERLSVMRVEAAHADERLAAVRAEFHTAEQRLYDLRQEIARMRDNVQEARAQSQEVRRESASAAAETPDRLGVTVAPGVVVAEVLPGTAADAAGPVPGDVIESVNGRPIAGVPELRDLIEALAPAAEVALRVMRAGTPLEFRTCLDAAGSDAPPESRNRLGLTVAAALVVTDVQPGRAADVAGVQRGDVLTAVNDLPVATGEQLRSAVEPLESRAEMRLRVQRGGDTLLLTTLLDVAAD